MALHWISKSNILVRWMATFNPKWDKFSASFITIVFHLALLLLFLLYKIVTPLPPYEEPSDGGGSLGMEINMGDGPDGWGPPTPERNSAPKVAAAAPASRQENFMTDESDDNYINEVKKPKEKIKYKELKRPVTDGPKITQKIEEPVVEERALYPSKKGGSEGKTGKPGVQGDKNGDPYSPLYEGKGGKGTGPGKGEEGKGTGPESGDGNTSNAPGAKVSLVGRVNLSLPKPAYTSEKSGKVVVDITVDAQGNVIKAVAGGRGTTVTDAELFRQAVSAAKRATFKPDNSAPEKQVGTITYNFIRN